MSKILAEKASRRIYNVINEVCYGAFSEDKLETITEMIKLIAADVKKKAKKFYRTYLYIILKSKIKS